MASSSSGPNPTGANNGQTLKWPVERYIPHALYIDQETLRALPMGLPTSYSACAICGQPKSEPDHHSGLMCQRPCVFCKRAHPGLTCDMLWCTDNFLKERFGRMAATPRPPNQRIKPGNLHQQLLVAKNYREFENFPYAYTAKEPIQPAYATKVDPNLPFGGIFKRKRDLPSGSSDYKSKYEAAEAKINALEAELTTAKQQLLESKQREAKANTRLELALCMTQLSLSRGQYNYGFPGSSYLPYDGMRAFGGPLFGGPSWQGHSSQQFGPAQPDQLAMPTNHQNYMGSAMQANSQAQLGFAMQAYPATQATPAMQANHQIPLNLQIRDNPEKQAQFAIQMAELERNYDPKNPESVAKYKIEAQKILQAIEQSGNSPGGRANESGRGPYCG